jgi:hypothetical protein
VGSVTDNDRVRMRKLVGRSCTSMCAQSWGVEGVLLFLIFTFSKILFLMEMNVLICEQKNTCTVFYIHNVHCP